MERKKRFRHRQPFWIPLVGLLSLAGLLMLQQKHGTMLTLLSQAPATAWVETVNDSLGCNAVFALAPGASGVWMEVDFTPPPSENAGDGILFEISGGTPAPLVRLAWRPPRFYLTVQPPGGEGRAAAENLPAGAPPHRLLFDWEPGGATLFAGGVRIADLKGLAPIDTGAHTLRLFRCEGKERPALKNLRLSLLRQKPIN